MLLVKAEISNGNKKLDYVKDFDTILYNRLNNTAWKTHKTPFHEFLHKILLKRIFAKEQKILDNYVGHFWLDRYYNCEDCHIFSIKPYDYLQSILDGTSKELLIIKNPRKLRKYLKVLKVLQEYNKKEKLHQEIQDVMQKIIKLYDTVLIGSSYEFKTIYSLKIWGEGNINVKLLKRSIKVEEVKIVKGSFSYYEKDYYDYKDFTDILPTKGNLRKLKRELKYLMVKGDLLWN